MSSSRCIDCNKPIPASSDPRGAKAQRCPEHAELRKKERAWANDAMRRARKFGVPAEFFLRSQVFERDNWTCHICKEKIPAAVRGTRTPGSQHQPLGPVVDHLISMSVGGPHTLENCRTAHWTCNAQKHTTEDFSLARKLGACDESRRSTREVATAVLPHRPLCSVRGCLRERYAREVCTVHYFRLRTYGDPLKQPCGCGCRELVTVTPDHQGIIYIAGHGVSAIPVSPREKLSAGLKSQPVSARGSRQHGLVDDCQVWTGSRNPQGYGRLYIATPGVKRKGSNVLAHRLAYELANGEGSAEGFSIDHLCGVRSCCNPGHLEAVSHAVNIARASEEVEACPQGHPYDEENTFRTPRGHRRCRLCAIDRGHRKTHGHSFVLDPTNPSAKKRRCLVCREIAESTPSFCPAGHEFTPENAEQGNSGRRCLQCRLNSHHMRIHGHEFVPDPMNPSTRRRRCLVCREVADSVPSFCPKGHEFTSENTLFVRGGRRCLQCQRNSDHIPIHGHEFVNDPTNPSTKKARCLTCRRQRGEI